MTDEDSRIMKVAGGGFEQCYNAQGAVDTESLLVLVPAPSDIRAMTLCARPA
jgi:hypothetical protein